MSKELTQTEKYFPGDLGSVKVGNEVHGIAQVYDKKDGSHTVTLGEVVAEYMGRPSDENKFSRTTSGLYRYFIPAPIHEYDAFGQEVQPITEDIPCEIIEPLQIENKNITS